jgi:hypothetical protein
MKFTNITRISEPKVNLSSVRSQLSRPARPKSKVSDPSGSLDEINIPEVKDQKSEFVYNFYTRDERVSPPPTRTGRSNSLNDVARYVTISWTSPSLSEFETSKESIAAETFFRIEDCAGSIVSEDNFFNPGYINHTFSNINIVEQGAADLENCSRISRHDAESVFKMATNQIKEASSQGPSGDSSYENGLKDVTDTYTRLSDFPKNSLGLRVYDERNILSDKDDLISSIADDISLSMKINNAVIPDIFENSVEKVRGGNHQALNTAYSKSVLGSNSRRNLLIINPITNDTSRTSTSYLTQPVKLIGYIIDRYEVKKDQIKKDKTFYIEDIQQTRYEDTTVLYGKTYIYSIRVVASVWFLTYKPDNTGVDSSLIYVSSRPVSSPVECYEYVPPPEPNNIRFTFDYKKRNLKILWDTPVNHQRDVKQFQVFRRKSIKEPFELISQYGFDLSVAGPDGSRYTTGERVDANKSDILPEDNYLVHRQDPDVGAEYPVYMHVDEDFVVDTEFFNSSEYIYAICSVDAHGMISNYSSQHHVTFDSIKNRLVTREICGPGSPRQYPNMSLKVDAFKDVIKIQGDTARQLNVYFTPEYLKVKDDRNVITKIVEAQTNNSNPYYLMQLINLDNQKTQLLKINIKDPQNLTL